MEESENKETEKKEKSLNIPVIAGSILVAIIAVIVLIPLYYRYTFDSVINKGNYSEIKNLINEQDFIEYASKEQGQRALEFVATNIASSSLNEKYDLMEKIAFKKFENEVVGKLVIASMTEFVTKAPIEERLKFLKNHNVVFFLNDNQRKTVVSSFVDYPITDIESSSLNKFFFEVCNEKEVENICNSIRQNHKVLPKNFVDSLITAILRNSSSKKAIYLKELLKNNESAKGYIQLYAYDIGKKNIDNNSEFVSKIESIFISFYECFNSEMKNVLENIKIGINTLNEAERTVNKDRVDSELRRLREKRELLPKSEYIEGYVKELVFDGSNLFPPSFAYVVTILGEDCLLITTDTKFTTTGFFHMYASVGGTNDLGKELKDICYVYNIRYVFMEISYDLRKIYESERKKLTKEINDIEANSNECYKKITELKNKLEECKSNILILFKHEVRNNLSTILKQDVDLFVKLLDFDMVKCPAGNFIMGSPEDELDRGFGEEQHKVKISKPFYIGKYEVTQKEYEAIMRNNPSESKGLKKPVNNISWYMAKEFCYKLNNIYKDKLPSGFRFDLPTEAQWEYACRAGTTTALNNGKNRTKINKGICPNLDEVAWYYDNSNKTIHEVGLKKPNAWGIYDMHGNVAEWCRDYIGDYQLEGVTDPITYSGYEHAFRGGDCFINPCSSAYRGGNIIESGENIGIRLVLVNDETNEEKAEKDERDRVIAKEKNLNINVDIIRNIMNNMVKCPAGSFMMGSLENELGRSNDEILHKVTISKPFYISKYEVTQEEYEAVMGEKPSDWNDKKKPVTFICWYDAKVFCIILNKYFKGNLPLGYKFDLPTEAQWEYACRAGTITSLNNGKNITKEYANYEKPCRNLDEVAWYGGDDSLTEAIHIIGSKKPNAWGIYDMHGNVWEWCRDWYGKYSEKDVKDPLCTISSSYRVYRGGGWGDFAAYCRSACRSSQDPGLRCNDIGFRLAIVADESYYLNEKDKNSNSLSQEKTEELSVFSTDEIKKQTSLDGFQIENNQNKTNTIETPKTTNKTFISDDNYSYKSDGYNLKLSDLATSRSSDNYTYNDSNNKTIGVITAKSGVNARKEPNTKAQKVGSFAYNKEVTILNVNGPKQTIENITSNWYKVTDGKITGWVFGGFIRTMKVTTINAY